MEPKENKESMKFEIPEIGRKALEYLEKINKESTEEEKKTEKEEPVASLDEMADILQKQAMKTHKEVPVQPKQISTEKEANKKNQPKMIIGLTGIYAGGSPTPSQTTTEKSKSANTDEDIQELLDFLEESINEYERYVSNIGRNGLAAVNVGYYRDDIQDILDLLKYHPDVNLRPYWERIVKIDMQLRAKAPIYVREVGYNNFKQYQIINDPPLTRWWWYLNRNVSPPMEKPKFWEIWKKI